MYGKINDIMHMKNVNYQYLCEVAKFHTEEDIETDSYEVKI